MVEYKIGDYVFLPKTAQVAQVLSDADVWMCGLMQVPHATPEQVEAFKKLKGSAF